MHIAHLIFHKKYLFCKFQFETMKKLKMISHKSEIIEHHGFQTNGNKQREFKKHRGETSAHF